MTKTNNYQVLIEHIQDLEKQNIDLKKDHNRLSNQNSRLEDSLQRQSLETQTLQTLSMDLLASMDVKNLYQLVCESLVNQLGWKSAFIVNVRPSSSQILGSAGATPAKAEHLRDYLSENRTFTDAYRQHEAISTFNDREKSSLSLRSLFGVDDLIAMPMVTGDQLYGYLVVGGTHHHERDMEFLANLAGQTTRAAHYSLNYNDLEVQNRKLRDMDELKNSFISITSHQLRTPLSIVKWILSVLQTDTRLKEFKDAGKMIRQAYDSNERLIHVVNDLLNVSRIQEGRLMLSLQKINISDMLNDLYLNTKSICRDKRLSVQITQEPNLPMVMVDPILFKECLLGLVDNAIDYNQEKGYIHLKSYTQSGKVIISIANSGIGISEQDMKKIYEQFYRGELAVRAQPSGNGLGLYLAQVVLKEHGGNISCVSKVGGETVFYLSLPVSSRA